MRIWNAGHHSVLYCVVLCIVRSSLWGSHVLYKGLHSPLYCNTFKLCCTTFSTIEASIPAIAWDTLVEYGTIFVRIMIVYILYIYLSTRNWGRALT